MATYTITHKFTLYDTVWIVLDCETIVECVVDRVTLEVDPDEFGVIEEKVTYHLDPVWDERCDVRLSPESDIFASLEDVLEYRSSGVPPTYPSIHSIDYYYTIDDTVWIVDAALALESVVNQLTLIIDDNTGSVIETTWYHVLPHHKDYSLVLKLFEELFPTEEDALDYILDQRQTPTPTPDVTPTVTPTPTFAVTPVVTPSLTPVAAILDEDFEAILDEYFDILLSE